MHGNETDFFLLVLGTYNHIYVYLFVVLCFLEHRQWYLLLSVQMTRNS